MKVNYGQIILFLSVIGCGETFEADNLPSPQSLRIESFEKIELPNEKKGVEVKVAWEVANPNQNFGGFNIYRFLEKPKNIQELDKFKLNEFPISVEDLSYSEILTESNSEFQYQVFSLDEKGNLGNSSEIQTFDYKLNPPTELTTSFPKQNEISLSWNESQDSDFSDFGGYEVWKFKSTTFQNFTTEQIIEQGQKVTSLTSNSFTEPLEFSEDFTFYTVISANSKGKVGELGENKFLQNSVTFPASLSILTPLENLQVKSTNGNESTLIQAQVKDFNGNPLEAETSVFFSFESIPNSQATLEEQPKLVANGQEYFYSNEPFEVKTDSQGLVELSVVSGTKTGSLELKAELKSQDQVVFSEPQNFQITAGPPANISLSHSKAVVDLASGGFLQTDISALVTDVYSNAVDDSTVVNFELEPVDFEKVIRRIPGTSGNPPVQCELVDFQNPVSAFGSSVVGDAFTYNESEFSGYQIHGVAFSEILYEAKNANGKVQIRALTTNGVINSTVISLPAFTPKLTTTASTQNALISEAGACWSSVNVTAKLVDYFGNPVVGAKVNFASTAGRFTDYVDLDGWANNCLYEVDQVSGELDPNSCYSLNLQLLNFGKPLPNYPEDFATPLQPMSFTNESGFATNTLVFDCDDVADPQQTYPPFPIISSENVAITVSVPEASLNDQPPSLTLTKQSYNPGEDPQTPADLKCRVGTCVNGASPWGSPFCFKSTVDPVSLESRDLKRRVLDFRSREVFEIPDASCTNWYTIGCGPIANLTEELEAQNAK